VLEVPIATVRSRIARGRAAASVLPVGRLVHEGDTVRHPQHRHDEDKLRRHLVAQRATHRVRPGERPRRRGHLDGPTRRARPTPGDPVTRTRILTRVEPVRAPPMTTSKSCNPRSSRSGPDASAVAYARPATGSTPRRAGRITFMPQHAAGFWKVWASSAGLRDQHQLTHGAANSE